MTYWSKIWFLAGLVVVVENGRHGDEDAATAARRVTRQAETAMPICSFVVVCVIMSSCRVG